jgi:hypothetical protein
MYVYGADLLKLINKHLEKEREREREKLLAFFFG